MQGTKQKGIVLQPRDLELFSAVGHVRLIDREHAQLILGLRSLRRTNERLFELTRAGLLRRFFVGTAVSGRKAVYTLSRDGASLSGSRYRGLKRQSGENITGDFFVRHQLEVSGLLLRFRYEPVPVQGISCNHFTAFFEPPIRSIPVIPDGCFQLSDKTQSPIMFLEVDRGTEALKIWQKKTTAYLELAMSAEFERIFHQTRFRVLVIANSERRMLGILETVSRITQKIFWFTSLDMTKRPGSLWSTIWLRPGSDVRQALL